MLKHRQTKHFNHSLFRTRGRGSGDSWGLLEKSIPLGAFVKLEPEAPSVGEIIENIKCTDRCLKQERKRNEGRCLWGRTFENSLLGREEKSYIGK